jgi:uncharacterized protein (DUF736 family)
MIATTDNRSKPDEFIALWKENDGLQLAGNFNGARLIVRKNDSPKGEKAPQHLVFVTSRFTKDGPEVEIGGLWEAVDRKGKKFFSGPFGQKLRFLLMQNGFKEAGDKRPDYILYLAESRPMQASEEKAEQTATANEPVAAEIPF